MSCGGSHQHGSDPLWLWHRPAAVALIPPLAWEPPYAAGVALKSKKKKRKFLILLYLAIADMYHYYKFFVCLFLFFVCFVFLGPHSWHKEVPSLGIKLELWLPAYTIAIAMPDLSGVCDLHHSSWLCWILNPLSEARDWTCVLMDFSRVRYRWATMGTLTTTCNYFYNFCSFSPFSMKYTEV